MLTFALTLSPSLTHNVMNLQTIMKIARCFIVLCICAQARAQDLGPDPADLIKLRQQFQGRVDQELIPWRDKYMKKLQKLEDRFVQERKLAEALAVRNERAVVEPLSSNHKPEADKPASLKSGAELRRFLKGTVWLVYASDDKKRENLLDVYQFVDSDQCYVLSAKVKSPWVAKSGTEVFINFGSGEIELLCDIPNSTAVIKHKGQTSICVLAGRPESVGK
jgi:hypothetical protein